MPANEIKSITASPSDHGWIKKEVGIFGVVKIEVRVENFGDHGILFYDVYGLDSELLYTIGGRYVEFIEYFVKDEIRTS